MAAGEGGASHRMASIAIKSPIVYQKCCWVKAPPGPTCLTDIRKGVDKTHDTKDTMLETPGLDPTSFSTGEQGRQII